MMMGYILVYQHNNVMNWSLNQKDIFLYIQIKKRNNEIVRKVRRKILGRAKVLVLMGGLKIFWMGGQGLHVTRMGKSGQFTRVNPAKDVHFTWSNQAKNVHLT